MTPQWGVQAFAAADADALRQTLDTWGAEAPSRLERRGNQKALEAWVLRRFLLRRSEAGTLTYPITVAPSEAPDFRIRSGEAISDVEIVEAVEEQDQQTHTAEAKLAELHPDQCFDMIEFVHDQRHRHVAGCLDNALSKKASIPPSWNLLIYLNTDAVAFEPWEKSTAGCKPCPVRCAPDPGAHGSSPITTG